jgi:hypothetical protein
MNNKLSNEELLKPRYKVIADYPYSPYKIGDVVSFEKNRNASICQPPHYNEFSGMNEVIDHMTTAHEFDSFPALFKKLEWWEDRKPKEIPQYLKIDEDIKNSITIIDGEQEPKVHKVKRQMATGLINDFRYSAYDRFISDWKDYQYNYHVFLPATEQEYLQESKTPV